MGGWVVVARVVQSCEGIDAVGGTTREYYKNTFLVYANNLPRLLLHPTNTIITIC